MLVETVELLERDLEPPRWCDHAALVQRRRIPGHEPLSERLLELWLGESRDLAVVGDPDQTIYTFTGATPDFLLGFAERHPGAPVVTLAQNYRSSPQILEFANRVVAAAARVPEARCERPIRTGLRPPLGGMRILMPSSPVLSPGFARWLPPVVALTETAFWSASTPSCRQSRMR